LTYQKEVILNQVDPELVHRQSSISHLFDEVMFRVLLPRLDDIFSFEQVLDEMTATISQLYVRLCGGGLAYGVKGNE
jgi:hypothetical protein